MKERETKGDPGSSVRGTLVGFSHVRWTISLYVDEGVVWRTFLNVSLDSPCGC